MSDKPSDDSCPAQPSMRSPAMKVLSLALLIAGAIFLARPFLVSADRWEWRIKSTPDLAGATVNARIMGIDELGVRIAPDGDRPMSIITAPLLLSPTTSRHLRVSLSSSSHQQPREQTVRFLWQETPSAEFRYLETMANMESSPTNVQFSLPTNPQGIHRFGIQFPDLPHAISVDRFELAPLTCVEKCRLFAHQLAQPEPLKNHSINFHRGPLLLGHGLNYYLAGVAAMGLGLSGLAASRRRRPIMAAIIGMVWFAADLHATTSIARSVQREHATFSDLPRMRQIERSEGAEIAWAFDQMVRRTHAGSTFAVVSDDLFAPAHRLGYLLAPLNIRVSNYQEADFIVVIQAADAGYDRQMQRFSWRDGPEVTVAPFAANSPHVYILQRMGT